jgi:hypothetical protein
MKDYLEIIMALAGLVGIAYQVAKTEEKIFDAIQKLNAGFEVHLKEYEIRREWVDYMLNGLNEKISHKFNRLHDEIKSINGKGQ